MMRKRKRCFSLTKFGEVGIPKLHVNVLAYIDTVPLSTHDHPIRDKEQNQKGNGKYATSKLVDTFSSFWHNDLSDSNAFILDWACQESIFAHQKGDIVNVLYKMKCYINTKRKGSRVKKNSFILHPVQKYKEKADNGTLPAKLRHIPITLVACNIKINRSIAMVNPTCN